MRLVQKRRACDVLEEPKLTPKKLKFLAQHLEGKRAPFSSTRNSRRTVWSTGGDKFSVPELEGSLGHAGEGAQWAVGYVCVELFRKACPDDTPSVFLSGHHWQ